MFRRLKLSFTWGPINNSSCDISIFFSNVYLQQSIIDVLDFPSLCRTSRYFTTNRQNKKRELYPIYHSSTQIPPSIITRLLMHVPRDRSQWLPQPRPHHRCIPWRLESKITEMHPIGYGMHRRRIPESVGSQFGYSIYPFQISSCSGFVVQNTVPHYTAFLILLKKRKE